MQIADALVVEGGITATGPITPGGPTINPVSIVAAAGATQGAATAIPVTAAVVNVTATLSSEGVKLPVAATGKQIWIVPPIAKGVKAYSQPAGTVINANATATTAYALVSGLPVQFIALSTTLWRAAPATDPGTFTTLAVSGLATLSGGLTVAGATKEAVTTVAAAGATQGTATAISAAAATVFVTTTTSSEGVKLPTAATGRQVTLIAPLTKGFKAYGGAAGQLINAAATATTAYAVTTGQAVTFYAVSATLWRVLPTSVNLASSLNVAGVTTLTGGETLGAPRKYTTVTIKATGNAVANARTVGNTAPVVIITATASTEGVKLSTLATGIAVTIVAPTGVGVLVYASAAGQSINAGTTNTTGVVVTKDTAATFYGVSTTKWRVDNL